MRRPWKHFATALVATMLATGSPAYSQAGQDAKEFEGDVAAAEARAAELAQQSEDRERAEESARRRRRMPNEVTRDLGENGALRLRWGYWSTEGPDFHQIADAKAGDVVEITVSAPIKVRTDADLVFGEQTIKTGNVAENYPGVYSLWLVRVENGWNAVFNSKPDVWGTMHDPGADVAAIPLHYAKASEPAEEFVIAIDESDNGGVIRMTWGEHQWTLPYSHAD